jgi:predicted  nucleic acid-binding Zn-ribbon protein
MRSLFDPIEDVKLPEARPPRSYKGLFKIVLIVVVAAGLGIGGFFGYGVLFPKKLTERKVPLSMDALLGELKDARDQIDSETRDIYGRIQQFNQRMEALGSKQVSFSQVFLQGLSAEEEQALDELVRQEKDPSYRGILAQVVEDMKKIRDLQQKVTELEAKLPGEGHEITGSETHMRLAREYLVKQHGVPESRAAELVSRLNIMETHMDKGMRVHFYYDPAKDFFGTWVAQGTAKRAPLALIRAKEMRLIEQRDTAVAKATTLEEKKAELEGVLEELKSEISALEARKASLESNVSQLEAEKSAALEKVTVTSEELERQRNSLFYEADLEDRLKARGFLRFRESKATIGDVKFQDSVDLRNSKSIVLKPSQFGIGKIRDVIIVPKYFQLHKDYNVQPAEDGSVEVTLLNEAALKGQKVVFVVLK